MSQTSTKYIVFFYNAETDEQVKVQKDSFELALDRAREKEWPIVCVLDSELLDDMLQENPNKALQMVVPENYQGDSVVKTFPNLDDAFNYVTTVTGFEIAVT